MAHNMTEEIKSPEKAEAAAAGVFPPLAFPLLFFQSRGRVAANIPMLLVLVGGALIIKFAFAWIAAKTAGVETQEAKLIAASTLESAEVAVVLLSFGLTRWVIKGPEYFGVLSFALLSMIVKAMLYRSFEEQTQAVEFARVSQIAGRDKVQRARRKRGRKGATLAVILIAVVLTAAGQTARAQSSAPTPGDDPVSRAMNSIEASIGQRAEAANRVIAASKLVNDGATARRQGHADRAIEALKEAQSIASTNGLAQRSFLIEELSAMIDAELDALSPKAARTAVFTSGDPLTAAISQAARGRLNAYRAALTHILEEEKVPAELLAVALVESGFNPQAFSPKGARGIWQFMPATARRYGLTVEPGEDHRTHPEDSTRAAARYLRDLYQQFGDWKLALAAYNAGEDRIQRVIDKTGIRDFDEMARRGYLAAETRKYVPAVLAAWARLGAGIERRR